MRETTIRVFLVRCCRVAACGALLTVMTGDARRTVSAQSTATPASSEIPDLVGVWDGGLARVRSTARTCRGPPTTSPC